MPTAALDLLPELGALGQRHANAPDGNVTDLVMAIAYAQPPIHLDRTALRANDLAGHNRRSGFGTAAADPQCRAAVLRQLLTVHRNQVVF